MNYGRIRRPGVWGWDSVVGVRRNVIEVRLTSEFQLNTHGIGNKMNRAYSFNKIHMSHFCLQKEIQRKECDEQKDTRKQKEISAAGSLVSENSYQFQQMDTVSIEGNQTTPLGRTNTSAGCCGQLDGEWKTFKVEITMLVGARSSRAKHSLTNQIWLSVGTNLMLWVRLEDVSWEFVQLFCWSERSADDPDFPPRQTVSQRLTHFTFAFNKLCTVSETLVTTASDRSWERQSLDVGCQLVYFRSRAKFTHFKHSDRRSFKKFILSPIKRNKLFRGPHTGSVSPRKS